MRITVRLAVLLALSLGPVRAGAQEYRWVRGTVTAVSADTLRVYVEGLGLHLAFAADDNSTLAMPVGVRIRPPEQTEPTLKDLLRVGEQLEVHYERRGDHNYAAVVCRARPRAGEAGRSVVGIARESTPTALTVEVDLQARTFDVQPDTALLMPKPPQVPAKKPTLDALVGTRVLVYYRSKADRQVALGIRPLPGRR